MSSALSPRSLVAPVVVGTLVAGTMALALPAPASAAPPVGDSTAYGSVNSIPLTGTADMIFISGSGTLTSADDTIYVSIGNNLVAYPPLATDASGTSTLAIGQPTSAMAATDDTLYVGTRGSGAGADEVRTYPLGSVGAVNPTTAGTLSSSPTQIALGGQGTADPADDSVYVVAYNGDNGITQFDAGITVSSTTLFSYANAQPGSVVVTGGDTATTSDDTVFVGGNAYGSGFLSSFPPSLDDSTWEVGLGGIGGIVHFDDSLLLSNASNLKILSEADWSQRTIAPFGGYPTALSPLGVIGTVGYMTGYIRIANVYTLVSDAVLDLGYSMFSSKYIQAASDGTFYVSGGARVMNVIDRFSAPIMSATTGVVGDAVDLSFTTGSGRLIDDSAVTAVWWGDDTIPFNRVAGTNSVRVSVPAVGAENVVVELLGGDALDMGTYTATAPPPAPPAPTRASAPGDVMGAPGDRTVGVTWQAPASEGSYAITGYQVEGSPGGQCLTRSAGSLQCDVTGLSNGTSYRFRVRALTGAGWGEWSTYSDSVQPRGPSITITGARDGKQVKISGTTSGFGMGAMLRPWFRFSGQSTYSEGSATILMSMDGTFTWQRKTSKKVSVYVQTPNRSVRSNTVVIQAR